MSMAGMIESEKNHKIKSFHRRNDSGELDVFEAARYFSGYNEVVGYNNNGSGLTQKMMMMREDRIQRHGGHRGRISLDMPIRNLLPQQFHGVVVENQINLMKEKKHKQPNSPGGRLASFLNSLFNQSASKKKKSKSSSKSMKEEDDHSPGGRRRRRSSISHFRSSSSTSTRTTTTTTTAATADSKSLLYSSFSSGGFTTPPHNIHTPTKSCKEFRTLSKYDNIGHVKSFTLHNELWDDHSKKKKENHKYSNGVLENHRNWGNELSEKEFRKFNIEVDDDDDDDDDNGGGGAESDSSSDLFELQNYDLGYCSSGLPVYETTNMDNIKRGAPISNGPL